MIESIRTKRRVLHSERIVQKNKRWEDGIKTVSTRSVKEVKVRISVVDEKENICVRWVTLA
jgi:CRISPR/Cas system type I-B associated protein Csh2 (Cas7 group RAMP superfamily)